MGRGNEQVLLNAATGNLLISHQDEFLVGLGDDASVTRTYNSLGDLSDENGDNWRYSSDRRVFGLTGTANTAGSTVHRTSADGSDITYAYQTINGVTAYFATDGAGGYDTLTYNGSTWTRTDGDSRGTETYAAYGTGNWRITTQKSADGYGLTFSYTADKLNRITTYDGSYVQYDWSGNNVTDILTGYTDLATSTSKTLTRTRYSYDSQNRLQTVTVDLSPEDGIVDTNANGVTDIGTTTTPGEGYVTTYTYVGTSTRIASIAQSDGSNIAITYDASNRVSLIDQTAATGVTRRSRIIYETGHTTIVDPLSQAAVRLDYDASGDLTSSATYANVIFNSAIADTSGWEISNNQGGVGGAPYAGISGVGYLKTDINATAAGQAVSLATDGSHWVDVTAGEQLFVQSGVEATGIAQGADLYVWFADQAGTVIGSALVGSLSGNQSFNTKISGYITAPAGAVSARFEAYTHTSGAGAGSFSIEAPILARSVSSQHFAYDASGDVSSVTDGLGNATTYTNFVNGMAQTITDPLGNVTTRTFGAKNEVLTETTTSSDTGSSAAAHTVRFAYDAENHLRYRVEADGSVTEYRYLGTGEVQYVVGYPEQFYDVSGLASTSSIALADLDAWQAALPDKSSIELRYLTYDARRNVTSERTYAIATTAGAATTAEGYLYKYFTYDQAGQLISRYVTNRNTETFVYDGMGRLVSAVDVNGGTTSYVFSDSNSKTVVTLASGLVQTSTYNKAGELISFAETGATTLLQAVTGASTYAYDEDGRLRWETDATANKSYHLYDSAGRKVADVDAAGEMVEYRYDADNRIVSSVSYATALSSAQLTALNDNNAIADIDEFRPASTTADIWNWRVYDKEGRLLQTIDGVGSTTINVYDGAGRLTQSTNYRNNVATATVENWKTTRTGPTAITNPYPVSDPANEVTRNFYDSDGRLVGTLDGDGYLRQTVYDHSGQPTEQIAYATATNTTYRASGTFNQLLTGLANASADRHTRYVYDGQGALRFVIDPALHVLENRYDPSGDGTTVLAYSNSLDPATTDFTYDSLDALTSAAGFASATDRKTWSVNDAAGRVAYSIDAEGGVTAFTYNSSGQVTKSTQFATVRATSSLPTVATMDLWQTTNGTNPANRVARYFYDGAGVLRYTVDAEGYVTRRTEDAQGRLTTVVRFVNPSAFDDTATIDSVHSWVTASGGTSAVTTNAYDSVGRLLSVTDPVGSVRRYAYNANGTLQSETAAYGTADASTKFYYYDSKGRVTEAWDAFGTSAASVTKYGYDSLDNIRTITDSYNRVTTRTFDHAGRILTSTDALNGVTSYQYNAFGEVVSTTDVLGRNSYNYYDQLGRLRKTADALKFVTETTYTSFGDVASVTQYYTAATNTPSVTVEPAVTTNAKDATTSFTYDKLGRLKSTTDAEGFVESYVLNAFGNRTSVTNKLGGVTTNTFDDRGLLLSETLPMASVNSAGTTIASTVTNSFAYDSRGNRISMTEAAGLAEQRITTYTYDKADRLISKSGDAVTKVAYNDFTSTTAVTVTTTGSVVPTETYAYDLRGNLIQVTDANGAKTFSYYDALDRKIAEVNALGALTSFTYDALGNKLSDRVYGDFVALPGTPGGSPPNPVNGSNYRETDYFYDELSRLTFTGIDNVLAGTWDSANNGVSRSTLTVGRWTDYDAAGNLIHTADSSGYNSYFWYDKLGRKTDQLDQEGYLSHWTYDAEGNVLTEKRYATKFTGTPDPNAAAPTVASDAANDRVTNFTYDRNGHRLTETRTGVAIGTVNASNGALTTSTVSSTVTYTYNGLGQVKTKQEAAADTVTYTYDNTGRLTKESRAAYLDQAGVSVTPTVSYYYNGINNLTRTQQGGATLNGSTDRITTYAYGAGGRLASMTDPAGGTHSYDYDAAGNLVRDSYTRSKSGGTTVDEGILYRRDLLGRVVTQTVATKVSTTSWTRGDSQNTQYDAYGEVSQRGVNGLWQESFTYNNRGLVEKTNSGDGVWRFFVYDKRGNAILEIESEGNDYTSTSLATVLTALGTYAGSTYHDGVTTTVSFFDGRGQTTLAYQQQRELSAGGTKTTIGAWTAYNAFGEVASTTDALGYVTSYAYNTMGRLTSKVMPTVSYMKSDNTLANAAPTEYYYYDKSGRLVATKDANGNITSHTLLAGSGYGGTDALALKEFHPDGGIAETKYDVFGDARTLIDEVSRSETRTYDKMGRLITQVNRGALLTENYTYDILGQRITHWNSQLGSTVKETTDYDLQGRVVSAVAFGGDAVTTTYSWSSTLATSGMGTFGGWTQVDSYANSKTMTTAGDIFGRDLSKTDLGGHAFTYTYDKAGRQVTRATTGETLTTTWLNSGLVSKLSLGASDYTNYTYDANGNKLTEYTVRGGVVAQNATATWDGLHRMVSWSEAGGTISPISSKSMDYDLNGNIRHINSQINNLGTQGEAIGQPNLNYYYTFDVMNRAITGDSGTNYYNAAGERVEVLRTQQRTIVIDGPLDGYDPKTKVYTAQLREDYVYNADGTLKQMQYAESTAEDDGNGFTITVTDPSGPGAIRSSFTYDAMQRQTRQIDYQSDLTVAYDHSSVYNNKSQVTSETTTTKRSGDTYTDYTTNSFGTGTAYALGSITQIDTQSYKNGSDSSVPDPRTINSYAWYDGAVQSSMTFDSDINTSSNSIYTSTYNLSPSGVLNSVTIADGRPRTVTFKSDLMGMVIRRDESDNISTQGDPHNVYFRFDGKEIASVGNVAPTDGVSYVDSIAKRQAPPPDPNNYSFLYTGSPNPNPQRDVINSYSQGSAGGRYTVEAGDTLQGIAYQMWGDSSLWYKIAEANGLSGDAGLVEGQSLQLPSGVTRSKNSASTFKPYDASEAIGDTSPTRMPKPPKKNKCGAFGQILLVAIAVAVTVVTSGAALAALAPASAGITSIGAGIGAMMGASTAGAVGIGAFAAAGAIGGAVGSIASQGFGVATGIQQQFSWKQVALSALQGGIGGAMSGVANAAQFAKGPLTGFQKFMTSTGVMQTAARGVGASALGQGIGVLTGLQDEFDWAGVAAAGVSAVAGSQVAGRMSGLSRFNERFFSSMASDIANAATRSVLEGSDFGDNMIAALPDIIGQTIGGMIADGLAGRGRTDATSGTDDNRDEEPASASADGADDSASPPMGGGMLLELMGISAAPMPSWQLIEAERFGQDMEDFLDSLPSDPLAPLPDADLLGLLPEGGPAVTRAIFDPAHSDLQANPSTALADGTIVVTGHRVAAVGNGAPAGAIPADVIGAAQTAQGKWNVPASVSIAQWILESGFGKHMPPGSNNPFGIKAAKGQPFVMAWTNEQLKDGSTIRIQARFRKFDSLDDAFDAHGRLLANGRAYASARQYVDNPDAYANALTGHYATDHLYGSKLITQMRRYDLYKYDH